IYSNLYGLYPFIKEKYGHSHFGWGGGMEHQTMTSLGGFSESLVAHELAHQWFGDMITMKTWPDIWLNEGFATYSVALYFEKKYNQEAYWSYMNNQMRQARSANGSVYVRDSSSVGNLFNGNLVYAKGATVLHMVRHVLGDSVFFRAIKRYANDSRFRFNVASTEDFRSVCEAESGKNLAYFFNEWIYGESYPRYRFEWNSVKQGANYLVTINVNQTTNTTNPAFFSMPIDFRVTGKFLDTTVTLFNNAPNQFLTFNLFREPSVILLDPVGWILRDVLSGNEISPIPASYQLHQNYPNPFNPGTVIGFDLPQRSFVTIKIYDALGREVATVLNERREAGYHEVPWNPSANSSGIYFFRLFIDDKPLQVRKMIFLR
ncbi:MAG: T9SS type A sorting domain-containing protein, partial [Ignavibacteriales bacterium]|nr:T9SS type A sorting domain-containing protein [Ignavibacteriales bacterium]